MIKNYFTREGLKSYHELIAKTEEELKNIQSQMGDAYANGGDGWHDNFSFEELNRQLTIKSGQLNDLKRVLNDIKIVEIPKKPTRICIGCTTKIKMGNEHKLINIGGYGESDPKKGVLAYNTPLGKILMKMKAGDKTKFNNFDIEIISVM